MQKITIDTRHQLLEDCTGYVDIMTHKHVNPSWVDLAIKQPVSIQLINLKFADDDVKEFYANLRQNLFHAQTTISVSN